MLKLSISDKDLVNLVRSFKAYAKQEFSMQKIFQNLVIVVMLVVATVIGFTVPLLHAKAAENTVELIVTRIDSWDAKDYVKVSDQIITKHQSISKLMQQADKQYDDFVKWCNAQPVNCMDMSVADIYYGPGNIDSISSSEALAVLVDLSFKDLGVQGETSVPVHGIHIEYNGKYYAITIDGL